MENVLVSLHAVHEKRMITVNLNALGEHCDALKIQGNAVWIGMVIIMNKGNHVPLEFMQQVD